MDDTNSHMSDHRLLTVIVVLGIIGLFGVIAIVFYVWRLKRPQSPRFGYVFGGFGSKRDFQGRGVRDGHLAHRITPFAFNGDGPIYDHTPGQNMRIATRSMNGLWAFHDIGPQIGSPSGVHDLDVQPSTALSSPVTTSSHSFPPFSPHTPGLQGSASFTPHGYGRHGPSPSVYSSSHSMSKKSLGSYFDFVEPPFVPPPPAYGADTIPSPMLPSDRISRSQSQSTSSLLRSETRHEPES